MNTVDKKFIQNFSFSLKHKGQNDVYYIMSQVFTWHQIL